jgi:hypothetical protein
MPCAGTWMGKRMPSSAQCSGADLVTKQEATPTAKGRHLIIGCPGSYPMKWEPHRDYCKEQPVISEPRRDKAIVFNWGGFKLSPEVRWSKPKSYEQLLPPMHKLKEIVIWRSTYCCLQVTGHCHTNRFLLLACFPYFEKIKAGLWDCLAVCISPPKFFILYVVCVTSKGSGQLFPELVFYFAVNTLRTGNLNIKSPWGPAFLNLLP